MGLRSSKQAVVEKPSDPGPFVEEEATTYLGEPFTKVKPTKNAVLSKADHPPVAITRLNHGAIEAADVDAVCEFYTKVLGFRKLPRPDLGFNGHWLEAGGGGGTENPAPKFMLHIIEVVPSTPRAIHNWKDLYEHEPEAWYIRRATHLAFEVEDFDAAEKTLRAAGCEYSRHVLPDIGMKQLFFYDPEGHGIEIGVYDDTRQFFEDHDVEPPT